MRLSNVLSSGDRQFFDLFEEAGGNIQRAVGLLEELLAEYPERNELAREILICEQDGDRITHDIIQRLNQTFVTPIDREDIYELASGLDDVVDFTEEVADYLGLYKIEAPMAQAQELAKVLHQSARQISEAMPQRSGHSSTTTSRPVRPTESRMVRSSSGMMVRRSTTSASMPSAASLSAAARLYWVISELATMVTSPPRRLTSARPIGLLVMNTW